MTTTIISGIEDVVSAIQMELAPLLAIHFDRPCSCGRPIPSRQAGEPPYIDECNELFDIEARVKEPHLPNEAMPVKQGEIARFVAHYPDIWSWGEDLRANTLLEALHGSIRSEVNRRIDDWIDGCFYAKLLQQVESNDLPRRLRVHEIHILFQATNSFGRLPDGLSCEEDHGDGDGTCPRCTAYGDACREIDAVMQDSLADAVDRLNANHPDWHLNYEI